jgi:DNA-binding transcriptional LysR family regulator
MGNNMDILRAMGAYAAVCERGSFTAAADELGTSKAAISKLVSALEAHLGCRLLQRTTRSVSQTEEGQRYHTHARAILDQNAMLEAELAQKAAHPQGLLRVTGSLAFGERFLAPLMTGFQERYPDVTIELSLSERYVDLVEEGYDVGVRIGGDAKSNLIGRKLGKTRMGIYASANYISQHGAPDTREAFAGHRLLVYSRGAKPRQWRFAGESFRPKAYLVSNNGDVLRRAMMDGMGIVRLPDFFFRGADDETDAVLIYQEPADLAQPIMAVYPVRQYLPLKVRAFIDYLTRNLNCA